MCKFCKQTELLYPNSLPHINLSKTILLNVVLTIQETLFHCKNKAFQICMGVFDHALDSCTLIHCVVSQENTPLSWLAGLLGQSESHITNCLHVVLPVPFLHDNRDFKH